MRGRGYDIANVPYTMYYQNGYAIHGAYWHNKFGTPVSHGCVNLALNQAKRLFNWANVGTTVVIQK
jgi:lipoprotein-anchoring transpeptidase ErfK/SrfK